MLIKLLSSNQSQSSLDMIHRANYSYFD